MSTTKKTVKVIKKVKPSVDLKVQFEGFKNFIKDQGLIGMAVGLVLGTASATLVKSLIDNIIMPPIGFILGSADGLKGLKLVMGNTANGIPATLNYGAFLNDFINFMVIAAVVYFVILGVAKIFGEDIAKK